MRSMQREAVRNIWDGSWLPNICGKQALYNGLAQFHQGRLCKENKSVGEEIARLEYAKTLFSAAVERSSNSDLCKVKDWIHQNDKALAEAKKDNDFIYHEAVPEIKTLPEIPKAVVAKVTSPLPTKYGPETSKDLFEELCPVAIHQALSAYDGRRQELVNIEVTKLKDATNLMNQLLSSMNLPAAIEATKGDEVPQSVRDKAKAVADAGGMTALKKLMDELPELLTRNTEILDECERMLKEERESDEQLKAQHKDKWNRTPSGQLTGTFNTNATKYRTIIDNAKAADGVVREKLDKHRECFDILSRGPTGLQSAIPSAGGIQHGLQDNPVVGKLRELMEAVDTIKAERQVIESEMKDTKVDMKPIFFDALAKNSVIPEQEISVESLGRCYGPLQKQVNDNIARQESIMKEVQENNEKFVAQMGGSVAGGNAREQMMKNLAAAHDAFFELRGNLQEGTKFYNDLTQLLVTFQNKVSDFCFARKTEKDELMKDLTSGLSQMSLNQPNPPAHHTPASEGDQPTRPPRAKDPPARPPPPQINNETPATTVASSSTSAPAAPSAPNPYMGAPANYAPPPQGQALPYPQQPMGMPMPYQQYHTPMPAGYNPYMAYPPQQGYAPYPPPQGYPPAPYPPGSAPPPGYYPPAQPGQPPQPGQQPQWR